MSHETPPGRASRTELPQGLTGQEARALLQEYGPNAVPEVAAHPWLVLAGKFWAPVPWLLEGTIALELLLGRRVEALVFTMLLLFNALLGFAQEHRAQHAVALLRARLTVQARARRDGRWIRLPARDLVPGDIVYLRGGDLVPADTRLLDGDIQVDQSTLTGEALPVELDSGKPAYAGSIVRRGEATAEVVATGPRTTFGKTTELVRTARVLGHLERLIAGIVRYLVAIDLLLVVLVLAYAERSGLPLRNVLPFALIILIASIPVALPATFTLATALGSVELAGRGVLVARLAAIEECAEMDVLCTDKTGTLTQNRPTVAALRAYPPYGDAELLHLAALACDDATQDPIDLAVLEAAKGRDGLRAPAVERVRFIAFDPATKRSGAAFHHAGVAQYVFKGAPQVIGPLTDTPAERFSRDVEALAHDGARILAVAAGPEGALQLAGLVALRDPPRPDSKALIESLHRLGVRTLMVTGDSPATAAAIAAQIGIGARVAPRGVLDQIATGQVLDYDVFARILPEGKFRLVQALQRAGHIVGMTGDGVNDAPALRQAEVGIAVAQATDVAKSAASLVLTNPGLVDAVAAVETSRRIHQRMLTYTLNKIVKTFEISLLLSLGLLLGRVFLTTPLLIVLLLFGNDFVTMSIAADRVSFGLTPDRWNVRPLVAAALGVAVCLLLFSFGIAWAGLKILRLPLAPLQTLVFVWLVVSGQATVYLVRERRHFWRTRPSPWLLASTAGDLIGVSLLAIRGWLMAPIPPLIVTALLAVALFYVVAADQVKVPLFRACGLR
jgi:H+-transporting ATPase